MKLPALWIAASFAAGIVLLGPLPASPTVHIAVIVVVLLAGAALVRRGNLLPAWILGLVAWAMLGGLAARLEQISVPPNHVTALETRGQLETAEPLRWRGVLRSDPVRLPWGWRYELDLDEFEIAGKPLAVEGGLRVSYFLPAPDTDSRSGGGVDVPPAVRAGDRIEVLLRARPPRNFRNPGAFDARTHLARQGVHLTGSLRSLDLLRRLEERRLTLAHRLARLRGNLLNRLDALFVAKPAHAALLRAMLLGDRSFLDHELEESFQRTAVYHILVVSGLHVAALAAFVFWTGRRLRLGPMATTLFTLAVLLFFVAVVEDRPPIQRAALMAGVYLISRLLFRHIELLNTVAVAALLILLARPAALPDPGFQLSFLAAGMIGGLALPWTEHTSAPYRRGLAHLGDVTRDGSHPPRVTQFRLEARAASDWLGARLPLLLGERASGFVTGTCATSLRLWEIFLVAVAIQIGMLPLMAHYFHRVTLAGPLANIPAVLLAGLIVPFGFLTLLVATASGALGAVFVAVLSQLVDALLNTVGWFDGWSWTSYRTPAPPDWLVVMFFAVLIGLIAAARAGVTHAAWRRRQWLVAIPVAAAVGMVALFPFAPNLEKGVLQLTVLDVGQGDALFLAFPGGRTMLIDGGGMFDSGRRGGYRPGFDVGEQVVSPYLWQRGLKRVDTMVLTHAHLDHMDGLSAVLDNFNVGELWVGRDVASPAYRALLERARARGVQVVHRTRGESFEMQGVLSIVLWPEDSTEAPAPTNNDSLVLRLEHGGVSFLLPGDIERQVEHELAARGDPLDTDILKAPHHGSRTSTTAELLGATTPRIAILSLGENNPFNHPHSEVLERLAASGARVLRTDRDGAVMLVSDGRTVRVRSFAAQNPN